MPGWNISLQQRLPLTQSTYVSQSLVLHQGSSLPFVHFLTGQSDKRLFFFFCFHFAVERSENQLQILEEFIIEAMHYLKAIQIIEDVENEHDDNRTYFKRSYEFWNDFAGTLNKHGNFEVEFSVEDPAICYYRAGIYVTV